MLLTQNVKHGMRNLETKSERNVLVSCTQGLYQRFVIVTESQQAATGSPVDREM